MDGGKEIDEEGIEDAFELLNETNERVRTGLWVGDCFIYTNSSWRLNYCVGGEVRLRFRILEKACFDFTVNDVQYSS